MTPGDWEVSIPRDVRWRWDFDAEYHAAVYTIGVLLALQQLSEPFREITEGYPSWV
jgi:hypothetical protein